MTIGKNERGTRTQSKRNDADCAPENRVNRRRLLGGLGAAGGILIAGCLGGSDDEDAEETEDEPDGTEGPSPDDDQGDGMPGNGEQGEGGVEDDYTPVVEEDELDEIGEEVYFGEHVAYEDSFVADLYLHEAEATEGYQEVHGDDFYVYLDSPMETEMYGVDGDFYTIVMGQCEYDERDPKHAQYVPSDPSRDDEYAGLPAMGMTTVDGEDVYVFEHHATYEYLSAETGYPVLSEWETGRAEFHSWGDVEPISAPDMPCEGE